MDAYRTTLSLFGVKSGIADFLDLPLKKLLAIVTLISLLSACAAQKQPADAPSTAKNDTEATTDSTKSDLSDDLTVDKPDPTLPQVALSRELMFEILSAEIAFQRG